MYETEFLPVHLQGTVFGNDKRVYSIGDLNIRAKETSHDRTRYCALSYNRQCRLDRALIEFHRLSHIALAPLSRSFATVEKKKDSSTEAITMNASARSGVGTVVERGRQVKGDRLDEIAFEITTLSTTVSPRELYERRVERANLSVTV